jgi:hypothetical protein
VSPHVRLVRSSFLYCYFSRCRLHYFRRSVVVSHRQGCGVDSSSECTDGLTKRCGEPHPAPMLSFAGSSGSQARALSTAVADSVFC